MERARRARHSAWGPLKAALTSNDAKSLDQSQIEQFERELASADEIADRLRREATRVAELAGLKASVYECERALERLDQVRESLKLQQTALERDWVDTWVQVPVRLEPPAAMRSFRLRYDEVRRTFEELEQLATERARGLRELETARSAMIAALRAAKVTIPETERLSVLLARAAQALSEGQALLRERQRLQAVLDEQNVRRVQEREALAEAEQELEAWRQDWEQALARAPLLDTKDPEQVEPVLDGLVELYARVDELRQLKSRIQAMEQDAREFEAEVQALVSAHAPELEARTVDDAAEELERRYREAERGRELLRQIDSELEQNERRGESVSATRRKAELELSVLCQVGGVDAPEELEAVEQRVESARRLEQDLASAEQELWSLASGLSLDALVSEAAGKERQHVAARLQEIEDELNEVEEKLQDVRVDAVRLERGLERYGDERAVELREQLESSTAEARSYLESYARIKLALVILEREVTAYRERHQGPVLARADGLFRELTLGRYQGLRVGLEENVLRCVRHDGAELEFESLSEGTQYQLYLALRIATIERYAESSGPLPLVLDDLLIHFDDERARAAFQVLGQLAERMQVLYFTHLSRDIELAEAASARQLCTVHCLPVPERQPRA